jgi:hypothetical protein
MRLWFQRVDVAPEPEPELTLLIKPGGSLIDPAWEQAQAARERARARSLDAQAASRAADAAVDIAEAEASDAARRARVRGELPEHMRGLIP